MPKAKNATTPMDNKPTYWLSYGGGVNSTAIAVLLCEQKLPALSPWRCVFADTRDEKDETYDFIASHFQPYLRRFGKVLEVVCDSEGVLDRFERLRVTGNRMLRSCTRDAKLTPIRRHIEAHGEDGDVQLVGIHADESHRAKDRPGVRYPLMEIGFGQAECVDVIRAAGLPVPVKSGCWHCMFARVGEVVQLALHRPDRFQRIVDLEAAANKAHPEHLRTQWGDRPATKWREMACANVAMPLYDPSGSEMPCGCYDGGSQHENHETENGQAAEGQDVGGISGSEA